MGVPLNITEWMKGYVGFGATGWWAGMALVATLVTLVAAGSSTGSVRAAVRVEPRSARELAATLAIADDVWSEPSSDGVVVVLGSPALARLRAGGTPYRVVVEDVDALAANERARLAHRASAAWFADYRDADEIDAYMDRLASEHPSVAHLRVLGRSFEGRPIRAIEVSRGGKVGIVLDGGHHAREWISVMVPICIADRLVTGDDHDPRIRAILDAARFVIIPVVNPDGYRYSWTTDRYWRKTRRGGYGVDLSRNYSVGWGEAGSSDDPRSPNYRGERPFSEPETRAIRDLFEHETIAAHVDFHSFSQVVVYPWSYQRADPPDRARFAAIADRMSTAMVAAHGQRYAIRPGSELQVGAGGTAGDWSYGVRGALAFLVELRPSSAAGGGFVLPPEQIAPTCDEGLASILELAESMIR